MWHQQKQKGQVLMLGLLFAIFFTVLMLRFFYVGLINTEVVRQRHALDAATYSGGLMQAQALNYASYVNRAYGGHQVAMAHLITMASWAQFASSEAVRVGMANPPASLITMMFGPEHGVAYRAASLAAGAQAQALSSGALALAFRKHDAFTGGLLAAASQAIYRQLPQWREQVIRQVLQDNYPELDLSPESNNSKLVIEQDNWLDFVHWQSGSSLSPWLAELVGHYDFLSQRNHTARNVWAVDARCPHKRHELRRRGQTILDEQGQWRAEDTQSFHALRSNRWIGCYFREYPMGWAWIPSEAKQKPKGDFVLDAPSDFSAQDFWRWVQDHTQWDIFTGSTNALATSWGIRDQIQWQGQGLGAYLATTQPGATLGFQTFLDVLGPRGQWLHSVSGAESYFSRPTVRSDNKQENSNLFHPFWQARLQHPQWKLRLQQLLGEP